MITCVVCSKTWGGVATAHCCACHQTFGGPSLFDRHRQHYGERGRCLDPVTVTDIYDRRVMWADDNGIWRSIQDYVPRKPPVRTP